MKIIAAKTRSRFVLRWAIIASTLGFVLMVGSAFAAGCPISGPDAVNVNESFTLCAAQGPYTYEWHGPGLGTSSRLRCVTVSGRSAGAYEYELIVRSGGVERDRCTHTVSVGGGAFGSLTCTISGPTSITPGSRAELCAPRSSNHSYHWSGPGGFTASTACITVWQPGTYDLSIVNDLTGYSRECSHTLTRSGSSNLPCAIQGPDVVSPGSAAQLCGPQSNDLLYQWDGPNNFGASSRCITVRTPGTYYLTIRSRASGAEEQCDHRIDAVDASTGPCSITGPASIPTGSTADLCAPNYSNSSYSWSGPRGFQSSQRCVTVRAAGIYRLTIRDRRTGSARECSYELAVGDEGPDDGDVVVSDNCPRPATFWQQQCGRSGYGRGMGQGNFTLAQLRSIARRVDDRSTYFNWSDDLAGFCQALNPARPLTYRKQVARNQAALLANVCAGELGLSARGGDQISLDPDTPIRFRSVSTVGELMALTDRMLARGTGSFSQLNQTLEAVNSGRGIGAVCP